MSSPQLIIKVSLLLAHAICSYYGMTPPTPAPRPADEKPNRVVIPDFLNRVPGLQKALTMSAKILLCSTAAAEAVALLAQNLPTASHFPPALSAILPTARTDIAPLALAAYVLAITGGLTRVWCHRTLGRFFTWEMSVRADHRLVTAGPYSLVRHPSYAGWLLLMAGSVLFLFGGGASAAAAGETFFMRSGVWRSTVGRIVTSGLVAHLTWVTGALLWRTGTEDRMLRTEFGKEWEKWARGTRYRLIPCVY